jgi:DNA-directed RNA polymerase specialized sigma subunit
MALRATKTQNKETHLKMVWPVRNQTWENNHILITKAMAKLMRKHERLPFKSEIAEVTGLSRFTVHKHLEDFGKEELMIEELGQFKVMSGKVLAMLAIAAMNGDIRAIKLALEVMGVLKRKNGQICVANP